MDDKLRVVFLGTPEIAVKSLEYLISSSEVEVVAVITQPDRPSGRGHKLVAPPVKQLALEHGLEVFQPVSISKDLELIEKLKKLDVDYFVTFAFGQILSQSVLDLPKIATINLHASLLPKCRGANPIQRALVNGEGKTGITTMITVLKLDAGAICSSEEIEITKNMNSIELKEIISERSPKLILSTLTGLKDGSIKPVLQDENEVTFAHKFKKEEGLIDWSKTAKDIHNQVRGLVDSFCAYTFFNGKMVKILKSEVVDLADGACCGAILNVSKLGILVKAGDGAILIEEVKPESKGKMKASDFANGAKIKAGDFFK